MPLNGPPAGPDKPDFYVAKEADEERGLVGKLTERSKLFWDTYLQGISAA